MFKSPYSEFIYKRTYARFVDSENRRENWEESVGRYDDFFLARIPDAKKSEFKKACEAIVRMDIMPSMRCLWTAGPALERENLAAYNCSYTPIDHPRAFGEILYILMNGTGVGFSVEQQYVSQLPTVPQKLEEGPPAIVVADSKLGWAKSLNELINVLYAGRVPSFDLSKVRPRGARLKTFGGRASGPEPLKQLFETIVKTFKAAAGRRLTSLECHDICCMIANAVVVGGARRSACISLTDLSDTKLAHAKNGQFWDNHPHRSLANNSVAYSEKPDAATFMGEWLNLMRSNSGERGIFNRRSAQLSAIQTGRRNPLHVFGVNPCGEVILRPQGLCNLTEVVVRSDDTKESLCKKVRQASILGCVQATLTKFGFVHRNWKKNADEERLLGVSLTGLADHPVLNKVSKEAKLLLAELKQVAIDTAKEWSEALNINMPAAITCVKPSGTVSQLVDCSSGIHPRWSPYYIRRVRVNKNDPVAKMMVDKQIPNNSENGDVVFEFPIKSPETSLMRDEVSAIDQLNYWLMLKKYWCEHNPSATIYVKENEWLDVGAWVYKNWDAVCGLTFLPYDGGVYKLAPYEEISEDEYTERVKAFPGLDFNELSLYEKEDATTGAREMACSGDKCELV